LILTQKASLRAEIALIHTGEIEMTRSMLKANVIRVLVALGTLSLFVLSAGAPHGYGS